MALRFELYGCTEGLNVNFPYVTVCTFRCKKKKLLKKGSLNFTNLNANLKLVIHCAS